ncbi:hypothetical protein [Actinobacillus minor]|uniref:hypothetical protein n=1 Tax=Actinobacillus minor TaxID=51047 RepID=UPI0023F2ED1C|nr:hypothetical protein [Actinobacillus minor]MDD6910150.1 hypothetical protein [Actinobacillus minor]
MLLAKKLYPEYMLLRNKDITPSWKITSVDQSNYKAITPNKILIEISSQINTAFNIETTPQYQSTMLWYHSLAWLRIIYNEHNNDAFVNDFIDAYCSFVYSELSDEIFGSLTSRDHLVAEQIRNLTYLLGQDDIRFTNKTTTKKILRKLINWATVPSNIANNNHGMMLVSALLHVPLFIEMSESERCNLITLSSNRLIEIIESAFDNYGLCNENTPVYRNFYIRFLRNQIAELNFLKKYDDRYSIIVTKLSEILSMAEHTLTLVALPTGILPPFGDGNLNSQEVVEPLDFAEFYSSDSGFYARKHKKLRSRYFSMKCGYSSATHKHSDDTSIFYWYDGFPIITDAGFLNYDWKDPQNVLVKSQRGHSGAFYYKYDDLYPITLYRDGSSKSRIVSKMNVEKSENLTIIKGNVCIDNKYNVEREVKFSHLNNILILDRFTSNELAEDLEKCIRFLIPIEHKVELYSDYVLISNTTFKLKLIYKSGTVSIKKGILKNGQPYEGWVVNTPFKDLKECNTIEIHLNSHEYTSIVNLLLEEC